MAGSVDAMTTHRIKNNIEFECDVCGEILASHKTDFEDAKTVMRTEGWSAVKLKEEWQHRCDKCTRHRV
jgi:hypothetical protein